MSESEDGRERPKKLGQGRAFHPRCASQLLLRNNRCELVGEGTWIPTQAPSHKYWTELQQGLNFPVH